MISEEMGGAHISERFAVEVAIRSEGRRRQEDTSADSRCIAGIAPSSDKTPSTILELLAC